MKGTRKLEWSLQLFSAQWETLYHWKGQSLQQQQVFPSSPIYWVSLHGATCKVPGNTGRRQLSFFYLQVTKSVTWKCSALHFNVQFLGVYGTNLFQWSELSSCCAFWKKLNKLSNESTMSCCCYTWSRITLQSHFRFKKNLFPTFAKQREGNTKGGKYMKKIQNKERCRSAHTGIEEEAYVSKFKNQVRKL